MSTSLIDIINKVGLENITCQWIDQSLVNSSTNKKVVTKLTVETNAVTTNEFMFNGEKMKRRGLIIWMPVDKLNS